jgi:tetratricopeptide (TPR) repeat protein
MKNKFLIIVLLFLGVTAPFFSLAQTTNETTLPPDAQEAVKKGIIAAKEQEWEIAIQSFQDARKIAPNAPAIYYNLGLAESKIPGRELRAIAWFGAYLAATPNAPNAAAVNDVIAGLQIKSQGNLDRLIQSVQDAAIKTISDPRAYNNPNTGLPVVAILWAETGDVATALKTADLIQDLQLKSTAQWLIGNAQVRTGDIAGAKKTFVLAMETADPKWGNNEDIAAAQADAGDILGAQNTVNRMQDPFRKSLAQDDIAKAQTKTGDISGAKETLSSALKTADSIDSLGTKCLAQTRIAEDQWKTGDIAAAQQTFATAIKTAKLMQDSPNGMSSTLIQIVQAQTDVSDLEGAQYTAGLIQDAQFKSIAQEAISNLQNYTKLFGKRVYPITVAPVQPVVPDVTANAWLNMLDDRIIYTTSLNTDPFLNLASYLTAQHSEDPMTLFTALQTTAETIIRAQNIIDQMLKQQAKEQTK